LRDLERVMAFVLKSPLKTILSLQLNHAALPGFSLWHLPHAKKHRSKAGLAPLKARRRA